MALPLFSGNGAFGVPIISESRYRDALETICGGRTADGADHHCDAVLILEDNHPSDKHAVRVEIDGRTVGYLDRVTARSFRETLRADGLASVKRLRCGAHIVGGWARGNGDRGHFGVWLDL